MTSSVQTGNLDTFVQQEMKGESLALGMKNMVTQVGRGLKKAGTVAGAVLAGLVFAVAHPIIGPLGSLGCLLAAAYHGLALNYHWRHSQERDEKGERIAGTALINQEDKNPYNNREPGYTEKDLPRLEHERQRLYHQNAALDSLKWARGLAKCTIPIVGPIWSLLTEINVGGSVPMGCDGCGDHWDHETPEERLNGHIRKLKTQMEKDIDDERNKLLYSVS